jgi:hypothetical protein
MNTDEEGANPLAVKETCPPWTTDKGLAEADGVVHDGGTWRVGPTVGPVCPWTIVS